MPYNQAGGANWGSHSGGKAKITLTRNTISRHAPQPQPKVGWDLSGRAWESISERQGWGKTPSGAEGRALLMLEKGKQLIQTSQGSRVCVRQQARDNPAQGEGLNCLQDLHKAVLSIAHFSLIQMFRVLSEEVSLSFLLCLFLLFSVDKTEFSEPAFVFLVMVLFSDFPTTRCSRKSQAGFTKHFPQTWHPASLAHVSPKGLVPVAHHLCPQPKGWQLPFPLPPCRGGSMQGSGIQINPLPSHSRVLIMTFNNFCLIVSIFVWESVTHGGLDMLSQHAQRGCPICRASFRERRGTNKQHSGEKNNVNFN